MFSSDEDDAVELSNANNFSPSQALADYSVYQPIPPGMESDPVTHAVPPQPYVLSSDRDSDNEIPIFSAPEHHKKKKPYYWVVSAFAAIGGFLFGYDTGVMSGAMLLLKDEFFLSPFWQELIISVTIGAAAISAFFGGFLNDKFGRKFVTILGSLIFTVGAILLGLAPNKETLMAGRFILGVAIGFSSMTVPMYIAECTPSELRGRLVTLNLVFLTGGQFFASIMAGAFSYIKPNGWRFMLGLAAVPAVIQFLGVLLLPESPRWLMRKGREDQARATLILLSGTTAVQQEYEQIKKECEAEQAQKTSDMYNLLRVLRTGHVRRAVVVGCALQLVQQLSGINTVMYYSATVIEMSGVHNKHKAIWLSAVTSFANFSFTLVGLYLVERIGRKKLLLSSLFGVMLSLILMAVTFQLIAADSPAITASYDYNSSLPSTCASYSSCDACTNDFDCGFCFSGSIGAINGSCLPVNRDKDEFSLVGDCKSPHVASGHTWAFNFCPSRYSWMAVMGLVLYLVFFAPGLGPMPWAVNSEIYPLWARSTGNSLSTATNWSSNLIVSMTFLTMSETISKYGTYWLFFGICVLAFVFFIIYLPETKGISLEEVETLFYQPWCRCGSRGSRTAYKSLDSPSAQ